MVSIDPKVLGLDPSLKVWTTIGGGIKNETCLEAAQRELFEETGLKTALIGPIFEGKYEVIYKDCKMISHEFFFTATVTDQERDRVSNINWTEEEKKNLKGYRWVAAKEVETALRSTRFLPSNLLEVIKSCKN